MLFLGLIRHRYMNRLKQLERYGQPLWLDYLGRDLIEKGGRPLVGRTYRRIAQPDGNADWPGQDLDGAPRRFGSPCARNPCLSVCRKRW